MLRLKECNLEESCEGVSWIVELGRIEVKLSGPQLIARKVHMLACMAIGGMKIIRTRMAEIYVFSSP